MSEHGFSFDTQGREAFTKNGQKAGYVERPEFKDADLSKGHWCATCPYMQPNPKSPTKYWCSEIGFPDQPWGCCDEWRMKENLVQT